MMFIYPQLREDEASLLLEELASLSAHEVAAAAMAGQRPTSYYPLGINRVSHEKLTEVRDTIVGVAALHGFPATSTQANRTSFDRALTRIIVELLDIVPSDAMDQSVWSFITLNLLPDVAIWRYPLKYSANSEVDSSYERLIGRPRNVFRRLWLRSFVFGPDIGARLGEDNWEGFYGRPSIAGNPRIARLIAREFFRRTDHAESLGHRVAFQDYLRETLKRILRMGGLVSLHAMPDDLVQALIDRAFDETPLA